MFADLAERQGTVFGGQIFVFSRGDILICGGRYGQFGGAKVAPDETAETNCK